MAYAMVLHGDFVLHWGESTPEKGLTLTEKSAAPTPWGHDAHSKMALITDARTFAQILDKYNISLKGY